MTCPHAFPSLAIPLIGMRVRVQVQAHTILMPIPAAIDAMIAAVEQEDIADDAPLATVASDAATDAVDIITIAADVARARAAAEPAHAGAACVTGARGGRAVRAGCRVPHHRGSPSGRQGGRRQVLTGADLFFLALKASTAYRPCARPARMRARGVRVRMWQTHPFVCR